ncbi:hypothetical protein RFM99_07420 [Mesorhizobium sp. VK4C]|uniref:hypothetical protein n=1 Tax=Mesorhizobium captivum TaxID=3072319 RepID=UPI002A23DCB0|nr:hypothetical protein [Mesorhizobium sp. VK4C]MDX8498245.1 hypothetical protein [Mesorhizobium sp. VK4C]
MKMAATYDSAASTLRLVKGMASDVPHRRSAEVAEFLPPTRQQMPAGFNDFKRLNQKR